LRTQRVFALSKNNLKRTTREPAALFMILMFPIILTLVFGFSFGSIGGSQTSSYKIGVVYEFPEGSSQTWSQRFIDGLEGTEILEVQVFATIDEAQEELVQGKIGGIIIIPSNFEEGCASFAAAPEDPSSWENATVQLYLDSGSMFATQAIPPIIQGVIESTIYAGHETAVQRPIQIGSPSLVEASKLTAFDYMAPGIFAFASLFLIMIVGESFVLDRESGLLRRIYTTPTTSGEFMASHVISNMLLAIIQVVLVFVMAFLVGYRPLGGALGLVMAFILLSVFSLSCVGFGLITASLARSPGAATGIAFIFVIPQMFLGTFVTAGISAGAQAIGKIVPSFYVTDALTSLFLRGAPVSSPTIILDLTALIASSVIVLLLGVLLFKKYGRA